MHVCTIIAKNYLAFARVLGRSLAENAPGVRFSVLVVDDHGGYIDPAREPFELLTPADLELPEFGHMAAMYDVLELSTAVKPWLLRRLLADAGADGGSVVYLDPDIEVFAPLDELDELIREHGLVLTPHATAPMPRDGRRPTEQDILIAGAFNLGFIGLRPDPAATELLDWWSERLLLDCISAPEVGLFVDQRWIDFVPGLVEHFYALRDPEFNVAYWNLYARRVERTADGYTVDGRPLRFFHFSGFDPERPHTLSKYQDRIQLSEQPALADLCRRYGERLLAEGHRDTRGWPYTYGALPSGLTLNRFYRRLYRDMVREQPGTAPVVWTAEGEEAFRAWLAAPPSDDGARGESRLLAAVWAARGDLQTTYPDPEGADRDGFAGWAHVYGTTEVPIPVDLLPAWQPGRPSEARPAAPLGVNVAGFLRSELGLGEMARQVVSALDTQPDVSVLPVALGTPLSREGHAYTAAGTAQATFPINLVCVTAEGLPALAERQAAPLLDGRYTIGLWWWEVGDFPREFHRAFDLVDEVWAGSRFVGDAIAAASSVPVTYVPVPLEAGPVASTPRASLGLPDDRFVFLFLFDHNSVFERKNPVGLIEAFTRAFDPESGAALVIKTINGERDDDGRERLRLAAGAHPHVHLREGYVSAAEKNAMLARCDAYVSLHRSEGFGLTMAEAMLHGVPTIATGYSGNLEFMRPDTSWLVDWSLTRVGPRAWPYPPDATWAEPDLDHAARIMRDVYEHRDAARERAEKGRAWIRAEHAPTVVGARMAQRLGRVQELIAEQGRAAPEPPAIRDVKELVARGPARSRRGVVVRAVRRLLLQAARPYATHQRAVDQAVLRALDDVRREIAERAVAGAVTDAAALRRLRALEAAAARDGSDQPPAVEQPNPGDRPAAESDSARA